MILRIFLLIFSIVLSVAAFASDYKHYLHGNFDPIEVTSEKGIILMGGGENQDPAFMELIRLSHAGNIVVLRTSDDTWASDHIFTLGMMNSVETLVIPSPEAANDPFVIERLSHASAVFIAGGDQYSYYLNWRNSAVSRLLNEHMKKGTPIAGTSAGLAILGEFAFIAALDTVDSDDCLKNPFDQRVTIAQNLLELEILKGWITDTHFHIRNRMGRMLTFMARTQRDFGIKNLHGLAVDEDTSVVINSEQKAYVIGRGAAYMMNSTDEQVILDPSRGLDYRVEVYKMIPTRGSYDFRIQQPLEFEDHYFLTSVNGVISSTKKNNEVYKAKK